METNLEENMEKSIKDQVEEYFEDEKDPWKWTTIPQISKEDEKEEIDK